jgi:hypothetical protein
MKRSSDQSGGRHWISSVLGDIHFWVPVAVLIGGLVLLRFLS